MSEKVNILVGKPWQAVTETLSWPPKGNSNVICVRSQNVQSPHGACVIEDNTAIIPAS